jgi:Ca2+-transporting ATPase
MIPHVNSTAHSPDAKPEIQDWYRLDAETAILRLDTDPQNGLSTHEAADRIKLYGPNTLENKRRVHWYMVLARQFMDVLIFILLAAAVISVAVGEITDAVTIMVIVILNGILGFIQEWKAEKAIEALQQMLAPHCRVVRDGRETEITAKELVPGDMVVLETGNRVPGDLRLIKTLELRMNESSLTGESESVAKQTKPADENAPLAEQSSMAWMGTEVSNGRARGVVTSTGMATEFGRIAQLTQTIDREPTPLQRKLAVLGKQLGIFSIGISVVVAVAGWLLGRPLMEMFLTGISLAVAVVPEGLPAVVTITLALGIHAMVKQRALIRRLQAAETLGAATVICTDKTGTLTQNEMTVTHVWLPSDELTVTGTGYDPQGHFEQNRLPIDCRTKPDLLALLKTGAACNHARIFKDEKGWHEIGEPTEASLLTAASKSGLDQDAPVRIVNEFSFNSRRKRMTIIEQFQEKWIAHVKGAPEVIIERCTRIADNGGDREMTESDRHAAVVGYQSMADQGLRTLALARRNLPKDLLLDEKNVEQELTLLGIVGIIDPPHREVPEAIRLARSAGIRIIMITGDAAATAKSIARTIGLNIKRAISGPELDQINDDSLKNLIKQDILFARTTPEHKLRIVSILKEMGEVVAMTGDGVNDAPALKKADIGIAMGIRGTDVAKGASDMILTDDNFASIIGAVEEGRRQYDNIQKFVRYLLSSNMGEVVAIFINILLDGPLILLPVQILWINLVTDGVSAVALGLEPVEKGIMNRPPRSAREPILNKAGILMIVLLGGYMGAVTLWLFHHYLVIGKGAGAVYTAQTVAFTGLIVLEMINVINFRALRVPLSTTGFFSNPFLLLAWVFSFGILLCAIYVPFLQNVLHTVSLRWADWGLILLVSLPIFLLVEAYKIFDSNNRIKT